jgi:DNA-directed RNA polymerase specialized sigma24 family protein
MRKRRRRPLEVELAPMSPPMVGDASGHVADRDVLERGFRRLKPEQRAVLVLHYYLGMPASAVADTLDIPFGTAQSRLHRALSALRAAVAADERATGMVHEVVA